MKRIVILGGGESGVGSAILAKTKGMDVFLSDFGSLGTHYKKMLEQWEIEFEEGKHTEELILNADEIIKSPGIPDKVHIVRAVQRKGIPIISEIEFAGRYTDAKTICITGSNGKTTTTTLIYEILKNAGYNVGLAGNIGRSFALQVATESYDWYVIELSSFQLDGTFDFRADIAVLTNITPDHLDRYDYQMQNYINSKFRIIRNQTDKDFFIYNADDQVTVDNISSFEIKSNLLPFSVKNSSANAILDNAEIICKLENHEFKFAGDRLKIKGIHNIYNVMASALAAISAGINDEDLAQTLEEFAGVEHRLEVVREKDGVLYVNDSKATNVDSVWYALESMTRPVIWIAGGTDKGNVYDSLKGFAKEKVKTLICMGLDNSKLKDSFKGIINDIKDTSSLSETMKAIKETAKPGDVVLLSPACASFDLFLNYEDRGRKFKEEVNKL